MRKILTFILMLSTLTLSAQETTFTIESADSITLKYFLNGEWDLLIQTGKKVLKQNIEFKTLRQRMGYAYFMKEDYTESRYQYQKSLYFDRNDTISHLYSYLSGLYNGDETFARYEARRLPASYKSYYGLKSFKAVDAIEFEYNYKTGYSDIRSAPNYIRIGINSLLGYRLNLYQTISRFSQRQNVYNSDYYTEQNEYYALLNWAITSRLSVCGGYHYVRTQSDSATYNGNLFYAKAMYKMHRLDFGISGSCFSYDPNDEQQVGIHAGIVLPGRRNIYLKSSLYGMFEADSSRVVFSQSAGILLFRKCWLEGYVTFGNLNNFVDLNGVYIFNSIDPITFRAGLSAYYYVNKSLTLFTNYTNDKKNILYDDTNYHQHSITGGIIWKF